MRHNKKTAASESLGDTLTAADPTQPTSNTTREEVLWYDQNLFQKPHLVNQLHTHKEGP